MNKNTLQRTLIPLITFSLICFIWFGPISFGYFTTIVATIVTLIGSFAEYRGKLFSSLGFQRENFTSKNILVLAPLAALGLFLLYIFVLIPTVTAITGVTIDYSDLNQLKGNLPALLIALPYVWASAAFGEEIILRGYFMKQFVKLFGDGKISIVINILLFACFFGFLHTYQGITGQIITAIIGGILATIFYLRKYDLWFVVAIHGFLDTIALLCIYFGLV